MSRSLTSRKRTTPKAIVILVFLLAGGCSRGSHQDTAMYTERDSDAAMIADENAAEPEPETEVEVAETELMESVDVAIESAEVNIESHAVSSDVGTSRTGTNSFGTTFTRPKQPPTNFGAGANTGTAIGVGKSVAQAKRSSASAKVVTTMRAGSSEAVPKFAPPPTESVSIDAPSTVATSVGPTSASPTSASPTSASPTSIGPASSGPISIGPVPTSPIPKPAKSMGPFSSLPAGSTHDAERGFATIKVFYATDRMHGPLPLSAYEVTGKKQTFIALSGASVLLLVLSAIGWFFGKPRAASSFTLLGSVSGILAAACLFAGQTHIEKHGVTYSGDRGALSRGICEVTVPDTHERGAVERPSLLRFEIREDQREHIVLTSAVELAEADFGKRLSETVSASRDRDLLVFIHGYNVEFESAVQRTAQIAVDLPFEGVPVCYSWPSQGTLLGYSVDETNAAWTASHLEEFLLELAHDSGAQSINVIAHSMGNRPMTAAMQQIRWQWESELDPPFDRIVLAAPDVDADRFRKDLAPSLLEVSNQVTLYASSDDQALVASKRVHGYPRAGESGAHIVVVPGVETIDVSGIDLSLLGHSYYGSNDSMLKDLYEVVRDRLPATRRAHLTPRGEGLMKYWQLSQRANSSGQTGLR